MQTSDTRSALLAYIVEHGDATVADLAKATALSDATVRRQLDRLMAENLLTAAPVRQATGRPYFRYRATDEGVRQQRDHSAALAARLLGQIGRGAPSLDQVLEGVAQRVASAHRAEVGRGRTLQHRVEQTVVALRQEGILDAWERTPTGFRLENHGCPYPEAADAQASVCECDRRAIELLVGAQVMQVSRLVQGDRTCTYVIEPGEGMPTVLDVALRPSARPPARLTEPHQPAPPPARPTAPRSTHDRTAV